MREDSGWLDYLVDGNVFTYMQPWEVSSPAVRRLDAGKNRLLRSYDNVRHCFKGCLVGTGLERGLLWMLRTAREGVAPFNHGMG